mgnify:CR=1 FL=1
MEKEWKWLKTVRLTMLITEKANTLRKKFTFRVVCRHGFARWSQKSFTSLKRLGITTPLPLLNTPALLFHDVPLASKPST